MSCWGVVPFLGPASHGEQLAPVVAQALAEASARPSDLTGIGVGRGPGPFTGLRVGLVHAEVMGWALGIRCTASAPSMCWPSRPTDRASGVRSWSATDARRREVYWARYGTDARRLEGPHVGPARDIPDRSVPAVGAGAAAYPDDLVDHREPLYPDPAVMARIAARMISAGGPRT